MIQTHRPIGQVVLFFIGGIVIGIQIPSSLAFLIAAGILILLFSALSLLFLRRQEFSCVFLLIAFSFLGMLAVGNARMLSVDDIAHNIEHPVYASVIVEGVIVSDVRHSFFRNTRKTSFTLVVMGEREPGGPVPSSGTGPPAPESALFAKRSGKIIVDIFRDVNLNYGDRIQVEGRLHRPFRFSNDSRFSYENYLRQRGIWLILSVKKITPVTVLNSNQANFLQTVALKLRQRAQKILTEYLSVNAAGIVNALILGERYDIAKEIKNLFVQTGTAHILAISGFNVGIAAFLIFLMLKIMRFSRRWQYILTMMVLIAYAFLTGGQPPVVRATIMAVVFLLGFLLEKESEPLNALALAAMVLLLGNPFNLFDVGFQLSFISVFFIIRFYSRVWAKIARTIHDNTPKILIYILQSLIVSIIAYGGVAGLIAYYFNIVTPITILANVIIIPLTSLITVLGIGLLVIGMMFPYGAGFFAICLKASLSGLIGVAWLFSQVPGAYFYIRLITLWQVLAYYLSIGIGIGIYSCLKIYYTHTNQLWPQILQKSPLHPRSGD